MVSEPRTASTQSWSTSSVRLWSEAVTGAYFPEERLKVIKSLKDEGSLREEDPWVFLNTPGTYYVCPCRSLLRRLRTHPRAQAPRFSRLINRTELSGLRGTALLIQKLVTVTPAQKHFLGSNSQLLSSLINLQPAKCPLTLRLTTWTLTRRPPGQGMPELFTITLISQGCNSEWLAVRRKTKQYFGSPRVWSSAAFMN